MKTKNCIICEKEFISYKNVQKYCSKECFKRARLEQKKVNDKTYYKKNSNKLNEYKKEWYLKNKERILKQVKEYRIKNKLKISKFKTEYIRGKRKTDINFRIKDILRHRIYLALKGICKSKSTIKLLGCSIEQLKHHLELQFHESMSFDNYGDWHIDHIKPCASFDLSKPGQQRKCFHYTNLQPLWAKDNLTKSDKIF